MSLKEKLEYPNDPFVVGKIEPQSDESALRILEERVLSLSKQKDDIIRAEQDARWRAAVEDIKDELERKPQHQMPDYARDMVDSAIDVLEELLKKMEQTT